MKPDTNKKYYLVTDKGVATTVMHFKHLDSIYSAVFLIDGDIHQRNVGRHRTLHKTHYEVLEEKGVWYDGSDRWNIKKILTEDVEHEIFLLSL